jgi:hypothetical protein
MGPIISKLIRQVVGMVMAQLKCLQKKIKAKGTIIQHTSIDAIQHFYQCACFVSQGA